MNLDVLGRLLLTGGSGFIGSALLWELNRRGVQDALVSDRLDHTDKWKNLVPLRFADYIDADDLLARVEREPAFLDEFGCIIHLGACSSTTETDSAYLMRNNYEYTKTLAEAALARGIRFVYASSAATYGALEHGLSEALPPASLRPLNMYAYSKHLFDLYAERTGMLRQAAGLKYFNVYGPNEAHKGDMRSVVAKAYDQIAASGSVRLFRSYRSDVADGEQCRDFIYVKDAVAMTLALATNDAANGIYNVGSGAEVTLRGSISPAPCSMRSTGSRRSNSSRCPRRFAGNTNTAPRPTSRAFALRDSRQTPRRWPTASPITCGAISAPTGGSIRRWPNRSAPGR